jgi:hypothetical protein
MTCRYFPPRSFNPRGFNLARRIIFMNAAGAFKRSEHAQAERYERLTDMRAKASLLVPGAEQIALLAKATMFETQVGMNALFVVQK